MSTELNFLAETWRSIDENGSMIWCVYHNKLSILYYFNDENIDLEKLLKCFTDNACEFNIDRMGWKLPFKIKITNSEDWNYDYFK